MSTYARGEGTTVSVTNKPGMKFYLAVVAAVVTYLLNQEVFTWPTWTEVLLNAAAVALAVWSGFPQPTTTRASH